MKFTNRLVWSYRRSINRYRRLRAKYRRLKRLLYPSPAEMRLVELCGGKVLTIASVRGNRTKKNPAGFPLAFVISMGALLRAEGVRREVRCGKYWIDFANDISRAIEVDGADYHTDIVYEQERDDYLVSKGYFVMHLPAIEMTRRPETVYKKVSEFLKR